MTALTPFKYQPDFCVPPGRILEDFLEARQMSARELARRCGRSAKLMVEIISGKAPLEPETALQFERVLGMDAGIWLGMEATYRLHLAKAQESERFVEDLSWAARFPTKDLEKRGVLNVSKNSADAVSELLKFFGVGSVEACRERFAELASVSYRHSPSFKSSEEPLLAWLRLGELEAEEIQCEDFDRAKFVENLSSIRRLTTRPISEFLPEMRRLCAKAGVAFVVAKPFAGIALSGVCRWLSPRKALIQQSMRHMANDHFWFTFFHEAAHLQLHSRKSVFLDGQAYGSADAREEDEANAWATNFLVPRHAMERFIAGFEGTSAEVKSFAQIQGVAPGIVVGQLQKRGTLQFSQMNKFKEHYVWIDG